MALASSSIVLRDPPPDDELRDALAHVFGWQVQPRIGIFFHYERSIEREPGVVVHSFWSPHHVEMDIRLVCDDRMGARYINVTVPDPGMRREIIDELATHFPVVSLAELRDAVRSGGGEGAWLKMALGNGEAFDAETFGLVREGLASPDAEQRRGAAQAAALLEWPQLRQPVHQALAAETNPDTRPFLEFAAQAVGPAL